MPIDDALLKSFALETRLLLVESLLLKLHILIPKMIQPNLSIDAAVRLTSDILEEAAVGAEQIYMKDEKFSALTSEERSLLADEVREILENLKKLASWNGEQMKAKEKQQRG